MGIKYIKGKQKAPFKIHVIKLIDAVRKIGRALVVQLFHVYFIFPSGQSILYIYYH